MSPGEIMHLEWRANLELEGVGIEVQVDRIDRLEDGRVVLLDYKTGATLSTSGWGSERLSAVQLPLYATLLQAVPDLQAAGIGLARVGVHEADIRGLGDEPAESSYLLSGPAGRSRALARQLGSWGGALDHWESGLSGLLAEFLAGDASHLIHNEKGLKYLGLEGLMRSGEALRWIEERGGESND